MSKLTLLLLIADPFSAFLEDSLNLFVQVLALAFISATALELPLS